MNTNDNLEDLAKGTPFEGMFKKNSFGQPTDSKGHVLKTTELIAAEIQKLIDEARREMINAATDKGMIFEMKLLNDITAYVVQKISENYQKNVSLGIDIGRREAQAIIDSAKEAKHE